jgi:hypothetical protein
MVIRVINLPHHLTLLLFVREAWSLAGYMDIPPLKPSDIAGTIAALITASTSQVPILLRGRRALADSAGGQAVDPAPR